MKLKNILIVVKDIESSKTFYKALFGLDVITDFGGNVMLTEGLVLQDRSEWEACIGREVATGGNDAELYFEENDMDGFVKKLKDCHFGIEYVEENLERDWGQRVIRMYDPDHHIIEIAESTDSVVRRFLNEGMSIERVAEKTRMSVAHIEEICGSSRCGVSAI